MRSTEEKRGSSAFAGTSPLVRAIVPHGRCWRRRRLQPAIERASGTFSSHRTSGARRGAHGPRAARPFTAEAEDTSGSPHQRHRSPRGETVAVARRKYGTHLDLSAARASLARRRVSDAAEYFIAELYRTVVCLYSLTVCRVTPRKVSAYP